MAYHCENEGPDGVVGKCLLVHHCYGQIREADTTRGRPVLVTLGL